MKRKIIAVYGASGFGREVLPILRQQIHTNVDGIAAELVFVDDGATEEFINNVPVMSYTDFIAQTDKERFVVIAIANSQVREKLALQCESDGVLPWELKAQNAVILDAVVLGEGPLLCPFTCITSNVRIGQYFHANIYSYVAHDCVIGDYVTFAPGVKCNGNVHIHDHAYIGTGAILKQGTPDKPLTIGKGAIVGMGAVVTKDVPPGVVVVGNPAKPLIKG
ncbi:NeuD/PglB/VioB family sugar acetyltransferase [Paenalcaligenes niemegkensis]|uniref:NeuD/PglB/VioB family sugar acetyltransferase n=1 Tax=Paenalcaligenes niemegkensis TaxID=2895469 RepID=UPI001EE93B75|nr:NeuD/PglB/VioB family sugar acetyltransferase [Paenalcaligenes niemegkensis]MCQ9618263.1 NeuD/PglB/VioB family sugar acetyltransferase [Paenalcaligenes niemegkensis]